MLKQLADYDALMAQFVWELPANFNIGVAVCDQWAMQEPDRICLEHFDTDGDHQRMSYRQLREESNRLANVFRDEGVQPGDRVGLLLPQGFETAIAHVAIYKLGAIAVPLALLFGQEALAYRLKSAGVKVLVTTSEGCEKCRPLRSDLPDLSTLISLDSGSDAIEFGAALAAANPEFLPFETNPETPAMMIFTSGTTGPPKGALHGHRVLLGHLPGVQMHHEFLPQPNDKLWTPADWAWAGGLLNVLLPGLYFGVPVVSSPAQKFDPELAFRIMAELNVRNAFIPPTALRLLKAVDRPKDRYDLSLRTIGSGGESLGRETFEWSQRELGLTINEFYGQTECNLVLSSNNSLGVARAGAIGKTVPGHRVAVIDGNGHEVPSGTSGQIAVKRPDPVMFIGYWQNEKATSEKFIGDWMVTGDQGIMSDDGYVEFFGRDDDVITSSGYRIGPSEIEDCLVGHPAVSLAAAVGKPDPVRTEIVKAYIVLRTGEKQSHKLAGDIQDWVKTRLSAHEYPREVEFVSELPLTTTGKVIRRELRDRARLEARQYGQN